MARVPNTPIYTGARRRSQRVLMQVGVRVSGADALGNNFEEYTETLAISAHGALVLLANRVTSSAKVLLRHNKTEEEQECHVAYLGPVRGGQGGNRFGVFLASPHVLARGFSSRRLDAQESRSPHGFKPTRK